MARNAIVSLVLFSIILNMASGFVVVSVKDSSGNRVFDTTSQNGYIYNENYSDSFVNNLELPIQPSGSIDNAGDQIYRVLDTLSLGFIYKFLDMINEYMFGFINLVDSVFGKYLDDDVRIFLFGNEDNSDLIPNKLGIFKVLITILYIITGIDFFTGKNILGD